MDELLNQRVQITLNSQVGIYSLVGKIIRIIDGFYVFQTEHEVMYINYSYIKIIRFADKGDLNEKE